MNAIKGIGWAILISITLYFGLSALFWVGYEKGKQSVTCDRAACMQWIIKYSK